MERTKLVMDVEIITIKKTQTTKENSETLPYT